jgi:hypothetical protein
MCHGWICKTIQGELVRFFMSVLFRNEHFIISIKLNRCLLMLFIPVLIILVIIYLIHITRMQLIYMLEKGDVDGALRVLQMFD